ncbi:MAG: ribose transport system permease protein [Frankiales bacterium]|nr:ribose transport system permease protein [Frankiales bacterium]MDX6243601.1 ribose transport system permease protein [Frankiales bacterium]
MTDQTTPPVEEQARVERAAVETSVARRGTLTRIGEIRNLGLLGVLVVLAVIGWVSQPDTFPTRNNLVTILTQASVIGVITVGMTFVIIGGGIDLSVGSLMGLASVWATTVATQDMGTGGVVMVALLVGLGFGLINGLLIAYGNLVPFIATLAMMATAVGLAQKISNKQTQILKSTAINGLATNKIFGLPLLVWLFVLVAVVGWVVLNRTTYGRRTFALGGNPEAARLAGVNTRLHTVSLYLLTGLCAGIAAIMIAGQTTSGSSTNGQGYELNAIAAVIIGGTLLAGGAGTLVGSVLGVLVFTTISNLLIQNNLQTEVQNIVTGVIIVLAVLLQRRSKETRG